VSSSIAFHSLDLCFGIDYIGGSLKTLLLSNVSLPSMQSLLQNLSKSCPHLESFDISKNRLKREDCVALSKFLERASALTELNLSSTKLPLESLKDILTSVSKDADLKINLSDNSFGTQAAVIIGLLSFKMPSIHTLDLSENDLGDEGIAVLAEGLCSCTTLKSLVLNSNFKSSKYRQVAIDNLVKLISSNEVLEALSIAGSSKEKSSQLKSDLMPFLYALVFNTSLTHLDISAHQMGSRGAIALARALHRNHSLVSILWDENSVGLLGFLNIRNALRNNQTVRKMPLPILDITAAMKNETGSAKELQEMVSEIQQSITRNHQSSTDT